MRSWLSPSGIVAAAAVGGGVWIGLSWRGFIVLAVFLVTGSLLTPGGGRRATSQVIANGAVAAACALLSEWNPGFVLSFGGAVAAATSDTWATEIGARSREPVRLITTLRPVTRGTSGGVTVTGLIASMAGAMAIATTALAVGLADARAASWIWAAGIAGSLGDSVAGATIQSRWRCTCGALIESPRHDCGAAAQRVSGWRIINNDAVNFLATVIGAAVALMPSLAPASR